MITRDGAADALVEGAGISSSHEVCNVERGENSPGVVITPQDANPADTVQVDLATRRVTMDWHGAAPPPPPPSASHAARCR